VLDELRIQGLGVIEEAVLPLGPGLTAVTGETGAGKTMVVTGLLLLFGGRADAARVRSGAAQASVDGRIAGVADGVVARVRDAGGEVDPEPDGSVALDLRRVVSVAGRSRAYVGGAPAPIGLLAELADELVAVHGQSDQLRLTRHGDQLDLLDRFAELDRGPYRVAYRDWRAAAAALADRTTRAAELQREADLLQYGLAEIDAAAPQPGEDRELADLANRLGHADALGAAALAAHQLLAGDPEDAADGFDAGSRLGAAQRALTAVTGADAALDVFYAQLAEATATVAEIAADLRRYTDGLDADPQRLEAVLQRRSVLAGLIRKYADPSGAGAEAAAGTDAVLRWADAASTRLAELDTSEDAIATLRRTEQEATAAVADLAATLSRARHAAADRLGAAVTTELAGLAMADAQVQIAVTDRAAPGPDGADDVEFLLRPHPSTAPLPIARGASGGELSRVMLALEVCLAGSDPVPTMVFDEVDAGVGGRAAVEVGRRLARLARDHQVIVVTHLAQVAAYADRQIVVDRPSETASGTVTASDVRLLDESQRVGELARMLAGSDTATAHDHAEELLAAAAKDRAETG
jgi:DNA repair protein RecN (Recombination protein N)